MDRMENRHMSWLLALTLRCLGGHTRLSPHWPAPCSSGHFNGSFVLLEVMTTLASFHNSCIYVIYIVSQVPGLRVKWWYWTIYFDGDCVPSRVLPPLPAPPMMLWTSEDKHFGSYNWFSLCGKWTSVCHSVPVSSSTPILTWAPNWAPLRFGSLFRTRKFCWQCLGALPISKALQLLMLAIYLFRNVNFINFLCFFSF